ncbi:MAG: glycerol-3-phosphate dehydrogenase [Betaproteobacteria bacterium RIFCSPLOWO2_12_FULL_62_58]|nr:MAG: glycerol-3-phosphate dehydrogenase [Betaproteobacteria bacterium RIFCSPLOWO2_12_FULL_62_58]
MKIAVLGAGAWGTAISITLAQRHDVTLWARDAGQCASMRSARSNQRYLPGFTLPANLVLETDIAAAVAGCELALVAVTTNGLRATFERLREARCAAPVVWLCKGFEKERAKLPHQVCAEELGAGVRCGALSGPSFAEEVARGLPTAVTLASSDPEFARTAARDLHSATLRVYCTDDVIGVEVAGAVKNVMAIAAGICDGLDLGLNARAALITRGLAEMTRLGVRLGGRIETFMGLAGAGDLILTCTGDLSRNRRVGLRLAQGVPLADILAELGHVAEGVYSAREVARLARELAVDMPITVAVCRVLDDPTAAGAVVKELLQREPKAEF